MIKLRWEEQREGSWWGYSGNLVVAMVICRSQGNPDKRWMWTMSGLHTRYITTHEGETKDITSSKRAAERSFSRWCEYAGLQPKS